MPWKVVGQVIGRDGRVSSERAWSYPNERDAIRVFEDQGSRWNVVLLVDPNERIIRKQANDFLPKIPHLGDRPRRILRRY